MAKKKVKEEVEWTPKLLFFGIFLVLGLFVIFSNFWIGLFLLIVAILMPILFPDHPEKNDTERMLEILDPPTTIICNLAGIQYHGALDNPEVIQMLESHPQGEKLTLLRDFNSPYDRYAIEVYWKGHKMGYVSSDYSYRLAPHLDAGVDMEARIMSYKDWKSFYDMVQIIIKPK